jgi:hypothetical protein
MANVSSPRLDIGTSRTIPRPPSDKIGLFRRASQRGKWSSPGAFSHDEADLGCETSNVRQQVWSEPKALRLRLRRTRRKRNLKSPEACDLREVRRRVRGDQGHDSCRHLSIHQSIDRRVGCCAQLDLWCSRRHDCDPDIDAGWRIPFIDRDVLAGEIGYRPDLQTDHDNGNQEIRVAGRSTRFGAVARSGRGPDRRLLGDGRRGCYLLLYGPAAIGVRRATHRRRPIPAVRLRRTGTGGRVAASRLALRPRQRTWKRNGSCRKFCIRRDGGGLRLADNRTGGAVTRKIGWRPFSIGCGAEPGFFCRKTRRERRAFDRPISCRDFETGERALVGA